MNELKELSKAVNRLQAYYDCNHEFMDADDVGDLLTNIENLKIMYHNMYVKQIDRFVDYLENALDVESDPSWLAEPYVITQGSKSVTIDNYADFYDGLVHLLKEHRQDIKQL